jgi:hypothetical protein
MADIVVSDHSKDLAARRARLQLRSAVQRRQLGILVESIDSRIRVVDQGIVGARNFLQRPAVLVSAAAVSLMIGPKRVLRLAGQAALLFTAARRLLRLVR